MLPFSSNTTIAITGTTGSGKTTWLYRLLKERNQMFEERPHNILYCYGVYQPLFRVMEKGINDITFHEGLPTQADIQRMTSNRQHNLVILDDLMGEVSNDYNMQLLFTQGAHHKKITVIYIT